LFIPIISCPKIYRNILRDIGFPGFFSLGPVWLLDQKEGQSLRNEWINENINFGMYDYEYENTFANKLLEIDEYLSQSLPHPPSPFTFIRLKNLIVSSVPLINIKTVTFI
jgi:hypothetical protein